MVLRLKIQIERKFEIINLRTNKFDLIEIAKSGQPFSKVEVWLGKMNEVKVYIDEDI